MHGITPLGRRAKRGTVKIKAMVRIRGTATLAASMVVTPLLMVVAPGSLRGVVAAQVNVLRVEAPPSIGPLCREINAHVGAANVGDTNTIHAAPFLEGVHRMCQSTLEVLISLHRHV